MRTKDQHGSQGDARRWPDSRGTGIDERERQADQPTPEEARQKFAGARTHLDPYDLKTLMQFYLLGDPSAQPVSMSAHALTRGKAFKKAFADVQDRTVRNLRRERLERATHDLWPGPGFVVPEFVLVESRLKASGAEYHVAARFPVAGTDRPNPLGKG